MTWFKVDDHLHSHRKAMRAGVEAMGLWVLAGSWAAAEESDGWVPDYVLPRLAGAQGEDLAQRLVTAGLWHAEQHDGEDGYRFHAWGDFQPTREQLDARRAETRERMRRVRAQGGDVRAHNGRSADAVTPTPTRPDPSRTKTTPAAAAASADFDAFWQLYPVKKGKGAAAKAFAKALQQTDVATIATALHAQVAEWRARPDFPQYVPHPTTWLNQGRWADDTTPALPGTPAPRPQVSVSPCDGSACPGERHQHVRAGQTFVCLGDAA